MRRSRSETSPTPRSCDEVVRAVRRRSGRALRRLQGRGRVDADARALLRQQRGPHVARSSTRSSRRASRRFVFSSSAAVYGTPQTLPVDEDHRTGPESPYGESKLMVEQMLRWFGQCHGLRSVALRYFNAAGASADARLGEDSHTPLNLVPVAMTAALGQIPGASGVRHRLPDSRRQLRSATTCTSTTSPTRTCARCATSKTAATRRSSTSAPAKARRCSK